MCERESECVCIKCFVAGSIPGSDKMLLFFKEKKLVVANIEILQCVARGVPRTSLSPPGKKGKKAQDIYILLIVRLNRWTTESRRCSWELRLKLEGYCYGGIDWDRAT